MNQFPPVLIRVFGKEWFEHGNLSLSFKNATVDLEKVQVFARPRIPGSHQIEVWMERDDGLLVVHRYRSGRRSQQLGIAAQRPSALRAGTIADPQSSARRHVAGKLRSLRRSGQAVSPL